MNFLFDYHTRRKVKNNIMLTLASAVAIISLIFPIWILFTAIDHGISTFNTDIFTKMTPPPDARGGLRNAIIGSLLIVGLATLIATPIGVMTGIYLAEYGRNGKFAAITRFVNDILLSAPSIVIGLFVYTIVVIPMRHFSGYAGVIALVIIAVPIIVRATENILLLIPDSLREAAYALGSSKRQTILRICLPAARNGILTGVLLSFARISGETAPLLFTALNNQFYSTDLNGPMANLPVVIFQFAMSPYENWQSLAWTGAALITVYVIVINLISRFILTQKSIRV